MLVENLLNEEIRVKMIIIMNIVAMIVAMIIEMTIEIEITTVMIIVMITEIITDAIIIDEIIMLTITTIEILIKEIGQNQMRKSNQRLVIHFVVKLFILLNILEMIIINQEKKKMNIQEILTII